MADEQRGKPGARVTLKFKSLPLSLPGEDGGGDAADAADESVELKLPSAAELAELERRPSSIPSRGGSSRGRDGWERQRRSATPPPGDFQIAKAPPPANLPSDWGDALSLVDKRSRPASSPMIDLPTEMADRFALGDFTTALRLAELILGNDGTDEAALATSTASREKLAQLYSSRLGSPSRSPHPNVEGAEVRWLGLDHRAGFLLSLVDGRHSVDELIDVSAMPRIEVLRTLVELLDMKAIHFID